MLVGTKRSHLRRDVTEEPFLRRGPFIAIAASFVTAVLGGTSFLVLRNGERWALDQYLGLVRPMVPGCSKRQCVAEQDRKPYPGEKSPGADEVPHFAEEQD